MPRTRTWTAAVIAFALVALVAGGPVALASSSVDYGPISHKGFKTVGAASTSSKLPLQIGFVANQSGIQSAIKSGSNPASSSYGKYPSLSTLQSKYGASSSKRKSVVNAFKSYGITATVDVTHLRVSASVSIGKAQKIFGTKWKVYKTNTGAKVALPVNTPKLPKGIKGNVDTVAGTRLQISGGSSSAAGNAAAVDVGTEGAALKIHNAGSIKPILESSLDAMTVSMVAPKLAHFDLWVHPLNESDDDGDVLGFLKLLAQPLQATNTGAPLPNVISVSYGTC